MDDIRKISVLNSDTQRRDDLFVREDRLKAFYVLLNQHSWVEVEASPMPGLSWSAILGLDAIFERRPKRFPARDILAFLANDCTPAATPAEVEHALERFAAEYPPDVA